VVLPLQLRTVPPADDDFGFILGVHLTSGRWLGGLQDGFAGRLPNDFRGHALIPGGDAREAELLQVRNRILDADTAVPCETLLDNLLITQCLQPLLIAMFAYCWVAFAAAPALVLIKQPESLETPSSNSSPMKPPHPRRRLAPK
jgi:hypothetical protein